MNTMKSTKKELAQTIGNAAREARNAIHLTQVDVADRAKISTEFYARIERGTSLPSIETFARLSSVLGVSTDVMLGTHTNAERASWAPEPPDDSPEIRRAIRRLRKTRPSMLRVVNLLLKEVHNSGACSMSWAAELADTEAVEENSGAGCEQ